MSWQLCYAVRCHHTTAISERLVPFYIIDHQCTSLYPFRVGWKAMLLGIGLFSEILPKSHWFCTPDCQPFFGHAHFMEQMRNHHVYLSMWKNVSLIDWLLAQWLLVFALSPWLMSQWKAEKPRHVVPLPKPPPRQQTRQLAELLRAGLSGKRCQKRQFDIPKYVRISAYHI